MREYKSRQRYYYCRSLVYWICMAYLIMLPVVSRMTCTTWRMFPGLDLYTGPVQHSTMTDWCTVGSTVDYLLRDTDRNLSDVCNVAAVIVPYVAFLAKTCLECYKYLQTLLLQRGASLNLHVSSSCTVLQTQLLHLMRGDGGCRSIYFRNSMFDRDNQCANRRD